ncbi:MULTISPECIES: thioredoxin family protein [Anaerolinea]|uniref:thioredoxin family protein n=1 Tax=Anaerolinea TaxID=233189 RepID=UPI002625F023|nr:thioredoxin family protein [Anaerolinea thermophila]
MHKIRRWLPLILLFLLGAVLLFSQPVQAQGQKVILYFFWGDGCPHCAKMKPFLDELEKRYPDLEVRRFEVWHNDENLKKFQKMIDAYQIQGAGVPTTFIGDRYWVGYNEQIGAEVEEAVKSCLQTGCKDAAAGILTPVENPSTEKPAPRPVIDPNNPTSVINLPLIGQVDLKSQSLLVSTLLISFVDGFNPCSVWVLTMLLALTLRTGSRKKIIIIGLVFLTVTAGIYALFIAGLFTVLNIISFVGWVQVIVALVAIFFGAVNIKDYFWYKEGISFTIADEKKPGIARGIRRVLDAGDNFWAMVGGTVVLAAGVSLVEFSCTAGFPVLWTNLLTAQKVGALTFVLLLLVYMIVYQVDELGIFFAAVFTLKASRLEEKEGRILKLIGGTLMLALAGVMLINPALMNDLGGAVIVFLIAFAVAGLILLVHRVILPHYGIWIGTEAEGRKRAAARRARTRRH